MTGKSSRRQPARLIVVDHIPLHRLEKANVWGHSEATGIDVFSMNEIFVYLAARPRIVDWQGFRWDQPTTTIPDRRGHMCACGSWNTPQVVSSADSLSFLVEWLSLAPPKRPAPERNSFIRLWSAQMSSHSRLTFSKLRSGNCRKPRPCLICPNTGSAVPSAGRSVPAPVSFSACAASGPGPTVPLVYGPGAPVQAWRRSGSSPGR